MSKKLFRKTVIVLVGLTVTAMAVGWFLPAFVFNELEFRQRGFLVLSDEVRQAVDQMVAVRTGQNQALVTDTQRQNEIPQEIEKALDQASEIYNEYEKLTAGQDRLPLLPRDYRRYLELKKPGFEFLKKELAAFRLIKEREHAGFRLARQMQVAFEMFTENKGRSDEEVAEAMATTLAVTENVIRDADKMVEQGVINEQFRDYLAFEYQRLADYRAAIVDPANILMSQAAVKTKFDRIAGRDFGVAFSQVVENWHAECLDDLNREMAGYQKAAFDQLELAEKYYREHHLERDPISRLLAKLAPKYPRNS